MGFIRHDLPYACVEFNGERLPWLGGDLQTLRTVFIDDRPSLPTHEEILIPVSDGDKILTALHKAKQARSVLIILHGLAGDFDSSYIARLTQLALAQNRHVLRVNLRGAGKGRAYAKYAYHAGRSDDLHALLSFMAKRFTDLPLYLTGYSLSGTMAVNLVARHDVEGLLSGLITFCAPLDMLACSYQFHRWRNWPYVRHFTKALIAQAHNGPSARPDLLPQVKQVKSVRAFDEIFTSQLAGYEDANDYYWQTTPLGLMNNIKVPTLLVHSDNDPWIDAKSYLEIKTHNKLFCVITKGGGHMGFHDKVRPNRCWQSAVGEQFFTYLDG